MASDLFTRKSTWYGGRGVFANSAIPAGTLIHTCPGPYGSVIYREFRKEVCAQCFAYSFDVRRNAWNIRNEVPGAGVWFCSSTCRQEWSGGPMTLTVNAAVDKLSKADGKRGATASAHSALAENSPGISQTSIDSAWENAAQGPTSVRLPLEELELETVRFVLSALIRRHTDDENSSGTPLNNWPDLLELQDNELPYYRSKPHALPSHVRIFAFIRQAVCSSPVLECLKPYVETPAAVRAVLARDPGNVFGLFEMNETGDSEMFGWCMYVSASFFNHDCEPNVRKRREGRALHFYTTRDIEKDEELCTNYVDLKDSVSERREQLRAHWYFEWSLQDGYMLDNTDPFHGAQIVENEDDIHIGLL
ncbi:unnamed protein product [Mycena citricolor]|uniref:SET domain-containing protein n=1 Tax=Mycena citricolor TaxID=2018698 RepID=A0AAD2HMI5_9AGAR|nr:unnamed protein product [Mycena citricolor]